MSSPPSSRMAHAAAAPQSPFDQAAVVSTANSAVVVQLKQSQFVQALQRQAEALFFSAVAEPEDLFKLRRFE